MSRRIDIELTSKRGDGSWTWRAAGAREPKGTLEESVLPAGAAVNDVVRAEVETDLDGTRVLSVLPPRTKAARTGILEILPSDKPFEPVTQKLVRKPRRDDERGPRRPRREGERSERGEKGERGERRERAPRKDGERSPRPARPRFDAPPELPQRPKAKRLRFDRTHVDAVLADLPEAQRTIAEKVLSGGIPAVRAAVAEQNKAAVAAGQDKVPADGLVQIAEQLLPRLRVAEWLDKAEGARRIIDDIDVRDLRAIVVASTDPVVARDEATRTLAEAMKTALAVRQESETKNWLEDIEANTGVGRVVRALKLSSQPPKAGMPFPAPLATRLAEATTAALTMDAPAERWIALLEAAAFSPVRLHVTPAAPSASVSADLTKTVMRLAPRMPQIAALFGVTVDPTAPEPRPLKPQRGDQRRNDRPERGRGNGRDPARPAGQRAHRDAGPGDDPVPSAD